MSKYASNTSVNVEKSMSDIKSVLRKYGAGRIATMEDVDRAAVAFEFSGLMIQMTVELPKLNGYRKTPTGLDRSESAAHRAWEQDIKQRWRALLLAIKAKLEAVECGISTVEKEFMAFVMMPNGVTFGEFAIPKLLEAAKTGQMPRLALPGGVQ